MLAGRYSIRLRRSVRSRVCGRRRHVTSSVIGPNTWSDGGIDYRDNLWPSAIYQARDEHYYVKKRREEDNNSRWSRVGPGRPATRWAESLLDVREWRFLRRPSFTVDGFLTHNQIAWRCSLTMAVFAVQWSPRLGLCIAAGLLERLNVRTQGPS